MTKRRESFVSEIDAMDQRRMCLGKMKFKNKNAARDRATRHRDKDHSLRPYKCLHCDGWHLTSIIADRASDVRAEIRRRAA